MPNQQWCGKHPADKDKKVTAERHKVQYIYSLLIAFVCQLNAHLDTWLNAVVTIAELGLLLNIANQPEPLQKNRQVHLAVKPYRFLEQISTSIREPIYCIKLQIMSSEKSVQIQSWCSGR
jgi:hypothetical protein